MQFPELIIIVYGSFVALGGIMGYMKARSLPSLIFGFLLGGALVTSATFLPQQDGTSRNVSLLLILSMVALFTYRFIKTRKFMPAGLLVFLSIIVLLSLLVMTPI